MESPTDPKRLTQSTVVAGEHLKAHKKRILQVWEMRARKEMPAAEQYGKSVLIDHLPYFIDGIVKLLMGSATHLALIEETKESSREHGEQRARKTDYTLQQVLFEYQVLRKVIFEVLEEDKLLNSLARDIILDAIQVGLQSAANEFLKNYQEMDFLGLQREQNAREEAEYRAADLKALIESMPDAVYIGNESGITVCNQLALDQLGFSDVSEMSQKISRLSDMIQSRDPATGTRISETELPFVKALHGDRSVRETLVRHLKTGEDRVIRGAAAPIYHRGKIVGAVAINTDITDKKQIERDLADTMKSEQQARQTAEQTLDDLRMERDLRDKFVATLTHDLRTPLTSARMCAQIILRYPQRAQTSAAKLLLHIDRTDRMIKDLLDANEIRAGQLLPISPTEGDLSAIVWSTIEDLITVHGDRFIMHDRKPIKGFWDQDGLKRVIENLCNNAVKYGDIHAPITVSTLAKDDSIQLCVHNEGPPIPIEEQENLFEYFQRAKSAKESGKRGWGIGLTLVRGVAIAHGGRVWVESNAKQGTTFIVELPRDARKALDHLSGGPT